jgi:hypothetical protein
MNSKHSIDSIKTSFEDKEKEMEKIVEKYKKLKQNHEVLKI